MTTKLPVFVQLAFGLCVASCSAEQDTGSRSMNTHAGPVMPAAPSKPAPDAQPPSPPVDNPSGSSAAEAGTAAGLLPMPQPNAASVLKESCASATVQSDLLPSNLLFVLDRSGSMNCNPPPQTESSACESQPVRSDPNKPSKWEVVQEALVAALQKLPANASAGISYFSNDDSCGVSSKPAVPMHVLDASHLSALKVSLEHVSPTGGTPIVGATILAYKYLHALALDNQLSGNSFVVLLTDGQQSDQCSDPDVCPNAKACTDVLTDREVPKAASPGADIRTFVIGVPGSEPARAVLSEIALQGGTAPEGCDVDAGECHFDMTRQSDFAAALSRALTAITNRAASCELPLPSSSMSALDLNRVNVVYAPGDGSAARVIGQDARTGCDTAQGWQYSADSTRIVLCGAICDSVRSDAHARVDVVLGCPVQGPS